MVVLVITQTEDKSMGNSQSKFKVEKHVELIAIAHPLAVVLRIVGWDGVGVLKAGQEASPCAI